MTSPTPAPPRASGLARASQLTQSRPRPQLLREHWTSLDGPWGFSYDDDETGEGDAWFADPARFARTITVPFPPESPASGIGDDRYHDVVWYSRQVTWEEVIDAGLGSTRPRLQLHFGAVDYRAELWVNGHFVGRHEGGHTPFAFDITAELIEGGTQHVVLRAEDRASDIEQPRGKQDWEEKAHVVWYRRTTGIWQPVWLEATAYVHIEKVHFSADLTHARLDFELRLNRPPRQNTRAHIELLLGEEVVGELDTPIASQRVSATIGIPQLRNGQNRDRLLWSADSPTLLDVVITFTEAENQIEKVASYVGLRTVAVADAHFLLNDRPTDIRSVLSQGYWPESHLAAPDDNAHRREVELILSLGFNSARVHQKIEDPRFLYWADRLGLLLWAEAPASYEFSTTAIARFTGEWLEALDRDRSHPSIVTWVPFNESWGVQDVATDPAQQAFVSALTELTRAVDPTRPVISNDGWEHLDSDIFTVHDYDDDADRVRSRYGSDDARAALTSGIGPGGRRMVLAGHDFGAVPIMLTEFGGIEFRASTMASDEDSWGYSSATTKEQFEERLRGLYDALRASSILVGTCYTQLTDTQQEANGLLDENRQPKLAPSVIRAIVTGEA